YRPQPLFQLEFSSLKQPFAMLFDLSFSGLDTGLLIGGERAHTHLVQVELGDGPLHGAVVPPVRDLLEDIEAEAALVDVTALDPLVEVHGVRVPGVDLDPHPQAVAVLPKLQRPRLVPPEYERRIVIDQGAAIVAERLAHRPRCDLLESAGPKLRLLAEHDEVALDDHLGLITSLEPGGDRPGLPSVSTHRHHHLSTP